VSEEAEWKLQSIHCRKVSDRMRAFRPVFRVPGIGNELYRSTIRADVTSIGAPGTVAHLMRESQTHAERCLSCCGYPVEGLQAVSEILQMSASNNNTLHL
jgi:hypothetical protein